MPVSLSMRWLVLVVCGALALIGCTTDTEGESGSLSLDLVINGDTEIDEVQWTVTCEGEEVKSGTINTSANGATASVQAYGLEPGVCTIVLEAVSTDGETTCKGETMFDITVGQVTEVHVIMNCKLPSQFGGVRVDGEFNICPYITWADASPLTTSVGNDIDLSAMATDDEGDPITYMWSSGSGIIADPMATSTTYTCTEVGDDAITILVTDDGGTYCMDMHTFDVTCVAGDGNPCDGVICEDTGNECTTAACNPGTGLCETSNVADGTDCNDATGMCMGGTCVDKNLCMDVVCEDTGNECTAAVCNPSTGLCETSNVTDGTSCGDGGACMGGTCIEGDLCENVTCDDTMNECTVEVCNSQTGMCDVMNVMDGTACLDNTGTCLAGTCEVGNQCDGVDCTSTNECIDGGTCNPSNGMCEGGGNQPINTPCETDGVCDGAGTCVACNDGTQCPDDTNECTMASCDMNMCGQSNVMNGMVCDLVGMDDGMCEEGTCVATPGCTMDSQCDDLDVCTVNTCPDGMCVSAPAADGTTCDADGTPGSCQSGVCVGLCDGVTCTDGIECTTPACNPANGMCESTNDPSGTPCTGGTCDGAGNCVPTSTEVDFPLVSEAIDLCCNNNALPQQSIIPVVLDVDPDPLVAGGAFTANLSGLLTFPESFLDVAQTVVVGGVQTADLIDGQVTALPRGTGASGAAVVIPPIFPPGVCLIPPNNNCDAANNLPGGGNSDCVPTGSFNPCQRLITVPTTSDLATCQSLDPAGCTPGTDCTKSDQHALNGFCVTGPLPIPLQTVVGNYTAGASGTTMLFGWDDVNTTATFAGGNWTVPTPVFTNPVGPNGLKVNASGLSVAIECVMAVENGDPDTDPVTCGLTPDAVLVGSGVNGSAVYLIP